MEYTLNIQDDIFKVTLSGDADLKVYYDFVKAVLEHEQWKPGGLVLLEESKLNTGPLTVSNIGALADIVGQYREQIGKAKIAIVVSRDLNYGMSRMWEILVENKASWYGSEQIFWSREDAIKWLKNE